MVAYSFAPQFRDPVAQLIKRQTVRGPRKRHARPGEPVQLYTAMRTMHCRKLVDRDPTCVSVEPIEISTSELLDEGIASIAIAGRPLGKDEIEAFAAADGFDPGVFGAWQFSGRSLDMRPATARYWMGWWWMRTHGLGRFAGVLIKWEPFA